ncbi:MAG: Fe3+-hydroxamate transporter substrate-binding protein [Paenibacillus sp.]|nr:Fe3+-hydroxamate transporter substrate-binding protein [Paenibacillus sp.]
MIEADANFHFIDIPFDALRELHADRVFMLVSDTAEAGARWRRLQSSPLWNEQPDVISGKVTHIADKWVSYDPLTLDWQLDDIVRQLV